MSSRNFNQLKKELTEYYRGQFLIGIYRIIGSINFFGNPYRLIRFFAEGIIEVVDSPVEGFIKGPI
jgi:vacuolar protein sorting-associated protein 13A/C